MKKGEIQKNIIPSVIEKIAQEYSPEKIVLFGSYAYGNPDDDSDIDLIIIKKTKESSMERWLHVHAVLSEYRAISISPLVYTPEELQQRLDLKDFFLSKIMQKGKVVYGKSI